ncbi:MAG TPA: thiamine diphosphokinase [Bacillota bacterium]|jgi:thiamine pyrophosphokinase|nr:thiamine diphosphokinase [Bacillota bacterium]HOL08897.1 thiamine diphosphokinase [Bacillota bacterium]HPO96590.1 thiamine diphosphokinase [Bacillota bacterium]
MNQFNKKVLIVAGGPIETEVLEAELSKKPNLIIAVDSGGKILLNLEKKPDYLIGDFDSLPQSTLEQLISQGTEVFKYPANKDYTDLELALGHAITLGAKEVRIVGGLGARLDHCLANIGLLVNALEKGVRATLIDYHHEMFVIDQSAAIEPRQGWAVSLVPLTPEVMGVTTTNLAFPLIGETLYFKHSRGIHNQFTGKPAKVSIDSGILLVIYFREDYQI